MPLSRCLLLVTLLTITTSVYAADNSSTSISSSGMDISSSGMDTNVTSGADTPGADVMITQTMLDDALAGLPLSQAGDTAWMLTSTALVLMMTPALGFFYGGLVNDKNILNQLFLSYICMGIVAVQWVLYGYSFAFDAGTSTWGTFDWSVLRFGEGTNAAYSPTYPLLLHAMYQGAFAIITPAIISGSIVGRIRFVPYVIFILLWTTLCYDPLAHWVWSSKGWLRNLGVDSENFVGTIDFAGGTVIHIASGVSGLVASMIVGKRLDYDPKSHVSVAPNLPFTLLGSGLLWVGWNGFNAGSAGAANGVAALAMVNTNVGAAAAMMVWCFLEVAHTGNPTIAGASTGAVVGLVVITPAAGYVQPGWAILMCVIGAAVCYYTFRLKKYMRVDDTLDVFTCHGVGGIVGALLTGCFAQKEWGGVNGAFYGRGIQLWYQLAAVLTTVGYAAGITAGILILLKYTIGLRPDAEAEKKGLDEHLHGESFRKEGLSRRESPAYGAMPAPGQMKSGKSVHSTTNNSESSTEMATLDIRQQTTEATYPIQSNAQAEALSGHTINIHETPSS